MVKSNKPLIIKSVKSAMHSLLTSVVLTIFKCIFHCFMNSYFFFDVDKRFEGLILLDAINSSINIHVSPAYIPRCYNYYGMYFDYLTIQSQLLT